MDSSLNPNPKGVRVKGITMKARGSLPPPPEVIRTDLTAIVPQMFSRREAKKGESLKVKVGVPAKAVVVEPVVVEPVVVEPVLPTEPKKKLRLQMPVESEESEEKEETSNDNSNEESPEEETPEETPEEESPNAYEGVPPELIALEAAVKNKVKEDVYTLEESTVFIPESSRRFSKFITTTFSDFALPPRPKTLNYNACDNMQMRTYEYQKFVREYMRQASPYRGILVYHGLGSGKTCTAIATAEALYGASNKKIIVMTPISLQENFINELSFCGFQHFRLQNFWVPFSLTDPTHRLFAQEVVGIPETYIKTVLRKSAPKNRVFWMPDFTKPSNFEELEEAQQTAVRAQIRATIQNRITFIGYTGISHDVLKQIACDKPDFFDNAVIVVDEIHNLTRLMRGKLEKYLKNVRSATGQPAPGKKPKKIPFSYEPFSTDVWKPKLCGSSQKYERAFLLYRLLAQARNSKIIALSGTPIVNFPEEVGILCNILHGYFHTVEDYLMSIQNDDIAKLESILKLHPRIQYYVIKKAEGYSTIFFSKVQDGYSKSFKGTTLQGVVHNEENSSQSIQEIYADVVAKSKASNLKLRQKPIFAASPLFPETSEEFTTYFVDTNTLHIKDSLLFTKRITGLISYYKGAKEELMPKVVKDEEVPCAMSEFSLGPYAEARSKEREEKTDSPKGTWDELQGLAQSESSSASYRFRSRAACNFVFPKGIPRPFPSNKKEFKSAARVEDVVLGDTEADAIEDDLASQGVAEALGELEADEEEEEVAAVMPSALAAEDMRIPYSDRIRIALDALRSVASRRFKLESGAEEEMLKNYSGKFVEILKRIGESPGSSLIYSQFKTLEGIGIFSIVLDTNGYAPLRLVGSDTDLAFSPETEESLLTRPEQPRYIVYSGEESKAMRQTLINIFNTKLSSLPARIVQVLTDSGLIDPATRKGNFKGEICKVFMITGAGAEGLSLRNIRTVHIMEPYWNTVRTDQVKGRAVRICSHSDLPYDPDPAKNQRTVEIFTYISVIPDELKKAKRIDQTLLTMDDGKTTDQHIAEISKAKEQVSKDFLQAMKEGAVDCTINQTENERISCFVYDGAPEQFMYDPRLKEDKEITNREARVQKKPVMSAVIDPEIKEYEVISYKKKFYTIVPKKDEDGNEYDALYLSTDRLLENELGYLDKSGEKLKIVFY